MSGASTKAATSREIVGVGRVVLWNGGSLWIGRDVGKARPHAHHAIQLSLALDDALNLYDERTKAWQSYAGAIVLPHQTHQFDGGGKSVAQIFVEPETAQGRVLLRQYADSSIAALPPKTLMRMVELLRAAFDGKVTDRQLVAAGQQALNLLCGADAVSAVIDPRIGKAIDFVRARLATRVTLAAAADAAHLSPSRFRHLFMAQTGISFRGYLLWARIEAAIGEAMSGKPWTEAAQSWGFADSAHLSRTCRRMFGIAPTMLVRE